MKPRSNSILLLEVLLITLLSLASCCEKKTTMEMPPPKPVAAELCRPAEEAGRTIAYHPTGNASTSTVKLEAIGPTQVDLKQPFEYEIKVSNLTDMELQDVVVFVNMPQTMSIQESSPKMYETKAGERMWAFERLGPKESRSIQINAIATTPETLKSCISMSYRSPLCMATSVVEPKLALDMKGPSEVLRCDMIPVTFTLHNPGNGPACNVRVEQQLPEGITTTGGARAVTFDAGTLQAGESREFKADLQASKVGTYDLRSMAMAERGLSAQSPEVSLMVREPVLALQAMSAEKQYIGQKIERELTVTNEGDAAAENTVIEATLPPGAQFASASSGGHLSMGKVVWDVGTLEPRASAKVTMTAIPEATGEFATTASARAACATPVSASTKTLVEGIPALLVEVIDMADPVEIGQDETYVITVTNQGSAPVTNISIVCTLEENMSYVSASGPTTAMQEGNMVKFGPLSSLAPKDKASWQVVIRAMKAGDVRFRTTVDAEKFARPIEETEATEFY